MPVPAEARLEADMWDVRTHVDPRLEGMARAYDLEVEIDEEAVHEALPYLELGGTEPATLGVNALLRREAVFKDVFEARRAIFEDEDGIEDGEDHDNTEGVEVSVYFSQRDVRKRRGRQEIVLPAIKEAINLDNPDLDRIVRSYTDRQVNRGFTKALLSVGVPTGAAVLGAQELGDSLRMGDGTEALQIISGLGAFAASGLAVIRYGTYLGQKAQLKKSPYQQLGQTIPKNLPPIVRFSRLQD